MTNKVSESYLLTSSHPIELSLTSLPSALPSETHDSNWYDWCEQADNLGISDDLNNISSTGTIPMTTPNDSSYSIPTYSEHNHLKEHDQVEPPVQEQQHIPVFTGNRPIVLEIEDRLPSACRTVRRNNKAVTALSLPNIWGANHRSLWPKLENTLDELVELQAHVGFHCEVWENKENKKHAL